MENAGASVLAAGNIMTPDVVIDLLKNYHVNVLTGDGSQIIHLVHHISTLGKEREDIKLDKLIYTSESLTASQKSYIREVMGPIKIHSILGSAEGGPIGAANSDIRAAGSDDDSEDIIIDTRMMLTEIFPLTSAEDDGPLKPVPLGQTGSVVQTSLTRLRNPLVRYVTGDIGSLHSLPEQSREIIPESDWPYMCILRLQGRDKRFSFTWDGEYVEFANLSAMMSDEKLGILQWQVILAKMGSSQESALEIRVLCREKDEEFREAVANHLKMFFQVCTSNQYRFRIVFVNHLKGFELSKTGQKVTRFIDRFNSE